MEGLTGFIMAAFALIGSPGPNTLSLAATGAAFGARRSLGHFAGLFAGMMIVIVITASGVAGVVLAIPGAAPILLTAAAGYMVYLAYKIATAPPLAEQSAHDRPPRFIGGVLLSISNPKAYAAMAALFSGFVLIREHLAFDAAFKVAVIGTIILSVNVAWLFVGEGLTRLTGKPGMSRAINIAFAVLLLASIAFVVFQ